jgi:hypothetical protein
VRTSIVLVVLLVGGAASAFAPTAAAQPAPPEAAGDSSAAEQAWVIPRIDGPVTIDGRVTEPAWEDVEPLPLTMYQPTFRGGILEPTKIRVAHDDEYIYAAAQFYDSNPDGIRENSLYRDQYSGDDIFSVMFDTFDDNENARRFFTTPGGIRVDMAISNDNKRGVTDPVNTNWNTFWTVETTRNEKGWFAEMRIPLSSLAFEVENDTVRMGMISYRFISRDNERYTFPAVPPNWNQGWQKPSQSRDVILTGVESERPVYFTPYVLGGVDQAARRTDDGTGYRHRRDLTNELGGDLKYNVTNNFTLDLTANTDFAQVEADPQRVNLTRFNLFFPEKRRFFQERASTFAFSTGGNDRLFNSRRIGLVEGEPVRILGGARLVGRTGGWDVGVLNMQTARDAGLGVPTENFGVARARRRVFNNNSYAGGIVTSRLGGDGTYNVGYGLDGVFRVTGNEYLTVKGAQTVDHAAVETDGFAPGASSLGLVRWERRRTEGLHYYGMVTRTGADYRPDVGFITRENVTDIEVRGAYGWFPEGDTYLRKVTPDLKGIVAVRNPDRSLQSARFEHEWTLLSNVGRELSAKATARIEDLEQPLVLPENTGVPVGRYTFANLRLAHGPPKGQLVRTRASTSLGTFYDGWRWRGEVSPTWNPSPHLQLGGTYQANVVRFPDRNQRFVAHVARARIQTALNTAVSTEAFVQYNSAASLATADVRFRYNFGQGNDLWVVYNESFNVDRTRVDPRLPWTETRRVLLKYTYTFQW